MSGLDVFVLVDVGLTHDELAFLAANSPELSSLALIDRRIGDAGAETVARHLPNLTALNLWNNQVSDAGAEAVARHLPNLTTLHLGGNQVGDAGILSILDVAGDEIAMRLRTLDLRSNPGLEALGLPEIAQTTDAVGLLAAYRELLMAQVQDGVPLGEVKLVVLGKEAFGKTSLIRAVTNRKAADPDEDKTVGVNTRSGSLRGPRRRLRLQPMYR